MSTPLRLCSVAPSRRIFGPMPRRRVFGTGIASSPRRYLAVNDRGSCISASSEPEKTTRPPCSPAPRPRSTMWSATLIMSASCSTTRTVLPWSRSRRRISIKRRLSRECRPIDGSSSTYSVPTSAAPSEVARLMRCASPPDSVDDRRSSVRYSSPTSLRNDSRRLISFRILSAIAVSFSDSASVVKNCCASRTVSAATRSMVRCATLTSRASRRSRAPPQSGQVRYPR